MTPKLQKQLFENWPDIFRQKDLNMSQTCMCWGIECGDGWYDLINQLCVMLEHVMQNDTNLKIEATQVKEKFGTLRFYTNMSKSNSYANGIISAFEHMSAYVCEECGNPGFLHNINGWYCTICFDCINKKSMKNAYQIIEVDNPKKYATSHYINKIIKQKLKNI